MGGVPLIGFPFSAVVGQDELKLALLLVAVDPGIGGVLIRGQKGSGKTTLARGLAALLPGSAPFVELPVGATEDRLVGTIDLAAALTGGERRFEPGLLSAAHGGVLYVDEVNLLPDHLVDVLLDVAASGVNIVEREGVSHSHPSRFVLAGSMNPEEGDLRPQLLDRFGLAVDVVAPGDPALRAEAVRRRMAFDADPARFVTEWAPAEEALRERLTAVVVGAVPLELTERVSRLCASVGAEGLRADLTICRAAGALAGWDGRDSATVEDVRRVAPLALAHRRRRHPLDDAGGAPPSPEQLSDALDAGDDSPGSDGSDGSDGSPDRIASPDEPSAVIPLAATNVTPIAAPAAGRRTTVEGPRGRLVGDRPLDDGRPVQSVAVGATVRAAAARRATDPDAPPVVAADLRVAVREQRAANLIVLVVDASGSMGAGRRMEAAKGAVVSLLLDAYQRRDLVALVTFRGEEAQVVLRPTGSVEVARARMAELPTGGRTPLAAGIRAGLDVASAPARAATHRPLLVIVTDGRATAAASGDSGDPVGEARTAADAVRRAGVSAVVIDAEQDGPARLGLARELAGVMAARYLTLPELSAGALDMAIRSAGATVAG